MHPNILGRFAISLTLSFSLISLSACQDQSIMQQGQGNHQMPDSASPCAAYIGSWQDEEDRLVIKEFGNGFLSTYSSKPDRPYPLICRDGILVSGGDVFLLGDNGALVDPVGDTYIREAD